LAETADAQGAELPYLEPIKERVEVFERDGDEQVRLWIEDYAAEGLWVKGYKLETGVEALSGLALRKHWSRLCRLLAFRRIGPVPQWRRDSKGNILAGPNQRLSDKPEDRLWPEMWRWSPMRSLLYVCRIPPEDRTKGGIIIPESAKQSNHKGWILNISPDVTGSSAPLPCDNPLDLIGSVANWGMYSGTALAESALDEKWDGEYLQLDWGEISGVQMEVSDGDQAEA